MKRLYIILAMLFIIYLVSCKQNNNPVINENNQEEDYLNEDSLDNSVVVYFSCTNNTKTVAEKIINIIKSDSYEIIPKDKYSAEDLNYNDANSRANMEQNNPLARPEIEGELPNLNNYEYIFIGYPIWRGKLPKIIYTFLESYDLNEKIIIPFCTSGGSSIEASVLEIKNLQPNAVIYQGRRFTASASDIDISSWIDNL